MREEIIDQDLIGKDFQDLWPKEVRPVRLIFEPHVKVLYCVIDNGEIHSGEQNSIVLR